MALRTHTDTHTLIPQRVAEFGQERQELSLQASWCETEALEQQLGLHTVSTVLYPKTSRNFLQPLPTVSRVSLSLSN